jgi:hypothetical protein
MVERRKEERLEEENELTITVESGESDLSQAKIRDVYLKNFTKNISKSGIGIRTEVQLPVDALIELEFTSKGLEEQIKAFGKVKWVNVVIQDQTYDAGIEFCAAPNEAVKKLQDYITWKLKENVKKKQYHSEPVDGSTTQAAKELEKQQPVATGQIETKENSPPQPLNAADVRTSKKKKPKSTDPSQRVKVAVGFLCVAVFAVSLFVVWNHLDEFNRLMSPELAKITTRFFARAPMEKDPVKRPGPSTVSEKAPILETTPAPASAPASASSAIPANMAPLMTGPDAETSPAAAKTAAPVSETKNFKVIGNSDTKRYHLPGMKYYNAVKAYHRVEFDSEADAIAAGYHKAPQ